MGSTYRFLMKQSIGAVDAPIVKVGDTVKRGQRIATVALTSLGVDVFSSVNGLVMIASEKEIVIEADEKQSDEFQKIEKDTPLNMVRASGLVGLGGAGFPTYAKFCKPFDNNKGTIIINAAECEPILCHNIKRIEKNPEKLIEGLKIAMEMVNAREGVIGIKEYHHEAVKALNDVINKTIYDKKISVHTLDDMYPMGEERALVREIKNILLPVTDIPMAADVIVINAETAVRIYEAVTLGKPFIDKDMTVAGKIKGNGEGKLIQTFLDVPIGIKVSEMFDRAGGLGDYYGELIMGGPFTGKRISLDEPVIKTTGGLIATECFMKGPDNIGILVCACGAGKNRLSELAESLESNVVGVEYCKQAHEIKGNLKCENPGKCPGQVQKVMSLKKMGAEAVLISNCTDCSNTVMSCAPKMGLPVYHCTDGALRAVNHNLIRKIH